MPIYDKPLRLNAPGAEALIPYAVQQFERLDALMGKGLGMPFWSKEVLLPGGIIMRMTSMEILNQIEIVPPVIFPEEVVEPEEELATVGVNLLVFYRKKDPTSNLYRTYMAWMSGDFAITKQGLASSFNWTLPADGPTIGVGYDVKQFSFVHGGKRLYCVVGAVHPSGAKIEDGGVCQASPGQISFFNPAKQKWFKIEYSADRQFTYSPGTTSGVDPSINMGLSCLADAIYLVAKNSSGIYYLETYTCDGDSLTLVSRSTFGSAFYAKTSPVPLNILPDGTVLVRYTDNARWPNTGYVKAYSPATNAFVRTEYLVGKGSAQPASYADSAKAWHLVYDASGYPNGTVLAYENWQDAVLDGVYFSIPAGGTYNWDHQYMKDVVKGEVYSSITLFWNPTTPPTYNENTKNGKTYSTSTVGFAAGPTPPPILNQNWPPALVNYASTETNYVNRVTHTQLGNMWTTGAMTVTSIANMNPTGAGSVVYGVADKAGDNTVYTSTDLTAKVSAILGVTALSIIGILWEIKEEAT